MGFDIIGIFLAEKHISLLVKPYMEQKLTEPTIESLGIMSRVTNTNASVHDTILNERRQAGMRKDTLCLHTKKNTEDLRSTDCNCTQADQEVSGQPAGTSLSIPSVLGQNPGPPPPASASLASQQ